MCNALPLTAAEQGHPAVDRKGGNSGGGGRHVQRQEEQATSGSEARGHNVIVKAQVPFAEMLSYANDLTSMTQGRASYSMEFSHYAEVPGNVAAGIISGKQK